VQEKKNSIAWPEGFTVRPATLDDVEAAARLSNACSVAQIGKPTVETWMIRQAWQAPGCDLENDSVVVTAPDGTLVGHAFVSDPSPHVNPFARVFVHPEHRSLGIGTMLSQWVEARARLCIPNAPKGARVAVTQRRWGSDTTSHELLVGQGYQLVRHWLQMLIEMDEPPPKAAFPEGLAVRTFVRDKNLRSLVQMVEDVFSRDHWGFTERSFEEAYAQFEQQLDTDADHDPTLWFLAFDSKELVGLGLFRSRVPGDPEMGYCEGLAVRRCWRRRGIGLALLRYGFGELYGRGKRKVSLDVDAQSLTGAIRLYEKAGMHVQQQSAVFEKVLCPGKDLVRRSLIG
jgi:mycothiol synthase